MVGVVSVGVVSVSLFSHIQLLLQLILDERILHHLSTILRPAAVSAPTVHVSIHYMFLPYRSLSVQHQCVATPPPDDSVHSSPHTYSNCRLITRTIKLFYVSAIAYLIILCSTIEMQYYTTIQGRSHPFRSDQVGARSEQNFWGYEY